MQRRPIWKNQINLGPWQYKHITVMILQGAKCTFADVQLKICDLSSFSLYEELLLESWKQLASMLFDLTAQLNLHESMIFLRAIHQERNI